MTANQGIKHTVPGDTSIEEFVDDLDKDVPSIKEVVRSLVENKEFVSQIATWMEAAEDAPRRENAKRAVADK